MCNMYIVSTQFGVIFMFGAAAAVPQASIPSFRSV